MTPEQARRVSAIVSTVAWANCLAEPGSRSWRSPRTDERALAGLIRTLKRQSAEHEGEVGDRRAHAWPASTSMVAIHPEPIMFSAQKRRRRSCSPHRSELPSEGLFRLDGIGGGHARVGASAG